MMSTMVILTQSEVNGQGIPRTRSCEEGDICMDKNDCPEYVEYSSLMGESKTIESRRLRSKVCNKRPDRLCCKVKTTTTTTTRPSTLVPGEASGGGKNEK